ncbi:MAG: MBL fold metallo-hydrolase [Phycisphaerae bacterium]|jgi:glyoxylase-like metal-dependent hydrolase (beta-lactamase superfamily II)|nr:MBL fold metallo-hydrolase [Phycisphaerae bacterium]
MSVSFRVISIGSLSAHPLWNERGEVRPGHSTTTLITSGKATILVDPSLPPQVLVPRLAERANLKPEQITHVFMTCLHPSHRRGLKVFDKAEWLVSSLERETIGVQLVEKFHEARDAGDQDLTHTLFHEIETVERIKAAPDKIAPGVDLFPLYGVTPGTAGLLLALRGSTVLVCGDAVPTQEHLEQGQVLSPCHDLVQARESFLEAVEIADFLIAGRDNVLINQTRRPF